jgi:integrase
VDVRSALDTLVRALGQTATHTFGDAVTLLLTEKSATWKPESVRLYTRHAEALRAAWGDLRIDELKRAHMLDVMRLAGSRSAARHRLVVATMVWHCAVRNELTGKPVPWRGVKPPEFAPRERWLSESELGKLWVALDRLEGSTFPGVLKAIRLLVLTGCRVSEITTARTSDVDLDAKALRLRDSKTGARAVPLGLRVVAMLKADLGGTWMCEHNGLPVTRLQVARMLRRIARLAGIKGLTAHVLRHTWVSHALLAGEPLEHVRLVVGHSTQWMTSRYSHLTASHVQHTADVVAERLNRSRK